MSTVKVERRFSDAFLKEVIRKRCNENAEIINVDVTNVVPPGENFTCKLLRIVIKCSKANDNSVQCVSVIAKILIENELVLKMDKGLNLFDNELNMYGDILPIMEELDIEKNIAPKACYVSKQLPRKLVIEDLKALNYIMPNRLEGLNLEHCLLTLEKLAYFHAASLSIYEKHPEKIKQFNKGLFHKTDGLENIFTISFEETRKTCQREPGLVKYVDKLTEDLKEKCWTSTIPDQNFNVLNHGDTWCNNLLFRYDSEGKLDDVKFIDFQVSVFTSPCFDLHYFIVTSTSPEVKKKHIKTIFNHYYDMLQENVTKLKIATKLPNRNDFYSDFCDKAYMGLATMVFPLPFIKGSKRADATLINFIQSSHVGSYRHHCFNNSDYLSTFQSALELYDSFGLFNN